MAKEATQETTAVAARGFLIWGRGVFQEGAVRGRREALSTRMGSGRENAGAQTSDDGRSLGVLFRSAYKNQPLGRRNCDEAPLGSDLEAYGTRFCRTHIQGDAIPRHCTEGEGSD